MMPRVDLDLGRHILRLTQKTRDAAVGLFPALFGVPEENAGKVSGEPREISSRIGELRAANSEQPAQTLYSLLILCIKFPCLADIQEQTPALGVKPDHARNLTWTRSPSALNSRISKTGKGEPSPNLVSALPQPLSRLRAFTKRHHSSLYDCSVCPNS